MRRVFGKDKTEDIADNRDITFCPAVTDGIFREEKKVAEDDEVTDEESCVRMLEKIPEVFPFKISFKVVLQQQVLLNLQPRIC